MKITTKLFALLLCTLCTMCSKVEPEAEVPPTTTTGTETIDSEGFDLRVSAMFDAEKGDDLIIAAIEEPLGTGRPNYSRLYSYSIMEIAFRCFRFNEKIAEANVALLAHSEYYLEDYDRIYDGCNVHWVADQMCRLIEFYGQNGSKTKGLLTEEVEKEMLEMLWISCKRKEEVGTTTSEHLSLPDHLTTGTWAYHGSENHHMMGNIEGWHFAKLAKDNADFKDRLYDDGLKAADHYQLWNDYLNMYFTERAKRGTIVEMMCTSYNTVFLKGIYNIYDFADDEDLKRRAGIFLDLYFAYWAQEQYNGTSGGGQSRVPLSRYNYFSAPGWLYFGVGNAVDLHAPYISAMTSSYRPLLIIEDIVNDIEGRGTYEVTQRTPGLLLSGQTEIKNYLDRDFGGVVRYSYCTPDFILGTPLTVYRDSDDWVGISSQSRLLGVVFEGGYYPKIYPDFASSAGGEESMYNSQWSVQKKGSLICHKLDTNKTAGHRRVFYTDEGFISTIEGDGWVFSEAKGGYAALKIVGVDNVVWGDTSSNKNGKWLICAEQNDDTDYAPVILEVAHKSGYDSIDDFKADVRDNSLVYANSVLTYTGLYGDTFTLYTNYQQLPKINGVSIDFTPTKLFDSPFLYSNWDSGIVTIAKDGKEVVYDFN